MHVKPSAPDEVGVLKWTELTVQSFLLGVMWMVTWAVAHFSMVLIGGSVLRVHTAPYWVVIPVEVIPASMLALAMLRLGVALPRTIATIKAAGDARGAGVPAPNWTREGGLLQRLMTPSDVDIAAAVLLAVVIALMFR